MAMGVRFREVCGSAGSDRRSSRVAVSYKSLESGSKERDVVRRNRRKARQKMEIGLMEFRRFVACWGMLAVAVGLITIRH